MVSRIAQLFYYPSGRVRVRIQTMEDSKELKETIELPTPIIAMIASFAAHGASTKFDTIEGGVRQSIDDIREASSRIRKAVDANEHLFRPATGILEIRSTHAPWLSGIWYRKSVERDVLLHPAFSRMKLRILGTPERFGPEHADKTVRVTFERGVGRKYETVTLIKIIDFLNFPLNMEWDSDVAVYALQTAPLKPKLACLSRLADKPAENEPWMDLGLGGFDANWGTVYSSGVWIPVRCKVTKRLFKQMAIPEDIICYLLPSESKVEAWDRFYKEFFGSFNNLPKLHVRFWEEKPELST